MLKNGMIEEVYERPSQYKWPNGSPKPSMWSMKVDNVTYGCKNTKPPAKGTYVQFEAAQDGQYWNADGSTIKEIDPPAMAATAKTTTKSASAFVDVRQDSIIYQSSRKDALEFLNVLANKDLIDFGKAKGAQKIELLEVYLDHYTTRFMEDVKRLAPPEHESPVTASAPMEATAITKPARKAKEPMTTSQDSDFEDDDLPF